MSCATPSVAPAPARRWRASGLALACVALAGSIGAAEPGKVTYEDDVLPIFRNNCLKCHNPDKLKGDLDLTSFSSVLKGGGSGACVNGGDPDGSKLYRAITRVEDPEMPPNTVLPDKDIATIARWIEGGLLQGVSSQAVAATKPAVDLSLKSASIERPAGPPPMPGALALDPLVHAVRGSAPGAIAASPWAPVIAVADAKQVALYDTSTLDYLGVLPFPEGLVCDVTFSRNGKLLLAAGGRGGQSGAVTVWDVATAARVVTIGDQFDSVLAADISSDQQWIALGGPDRVLKIYRTKDGGLEHRIKKHTDWVTAVEYSPNSRYLATGDRNGGLVLWGAEDGQEMFTLPGHKGAITAITWRADSEMFVSASEDGTLKLWKAGDGAALKSIAAHPGGVLAARFAPDGRIVSSGRDNKVKVWDAAGKNTVTPNFTGEVPTRVAFSDDAKRIIASDWKGRVFVWDSANGKAVGELEAYPPTLAERVKRESGRIAALEAEIAKAKSAPAASEKEAKASAARLADLTAQLASAQHSLTKWTSALENAQTASRAGKA